MSQIRFKPKKINKQTIVITGASSGIGRATAILAGKRGARVVLAARSEHDLQEIENEITKKGGKALIVVADVSKESDLINLRDKAIEKFGSIDTWINNAGTSIYGYFFDSDIEEERKLFETNFWGARLGSQLAAEAMKKNGGVLINLGSEVSVAAQPLLGMYSASKHALKAFTDAFRSEIRDRDIPVEVCLVRPTAIDTMFAEHGTDTLPSGEPSLPPPLTRPEVAAEALLKCAENPQRDVYVGGPARLSAVLDTFFPQVKDMMAESRMKDFRKGAGRPHGQNENLDHAPAENKVPGAYVGKHYDKSLYTDITTMSVLRTLKNNLKSSLNEYRKEHGH